MKCHYEVLNIQRTADDAEIKSAYKRLALKWHPDKNLDDTESAKEQFQLVQQAYEVLSDRQERAWYDKHRDQILHRSNGPAEDNSLDLYQYFTSSCFKGYGDDDNSFYTVYRNIFEQVAKEDLSFMDSKEEFASIPTFGHSYSTYDDVVGPFYSYWMGYSTKKSYAWLDPHDVDNVRQRKLFKLIEKENKKVRLKARKERNEEVRALVAFVKKRDKRMQLYVQQLEAKNLENRQKQEQISRQRRLDRQKELDDHAGNQAEWAKFDNVSKELEEIEKHLLEQFGNESFDDDEADEEDSDLYCVACNKMFRTPKAFQNHESSKKHKENVQKLKETMAEEENDYLSGSDQGVDQEFEIVDDTDCKEADEKLEALTENEDVSFHAEVNEIKHKKNKKKKKQAKVASTEVEHDNPTEIDVNGKLDDSDSDFDFSSSRKSIAKKKNRKSTTTGKAKIDVTTEKEKSPDFEQQLNSAKIDCSKSTFDVENEDVIANKNHVCVTCKANFPSKNKLFNHLKKTGHSVYIPSEKPIVNAKKTKCK